MRSVILLVISISSLLVSTLIEPQGTEARLSKPQIEATGLLPQSLEEIVREEMGRLDTIANFQTEVHVTDASNSTAEPNNVILISRRQLNNIQGRVEAKQFRLILRFLLAHEKTHQVQYRLYSAAAVRTDDSERHRIYEAQADVLAGKYLMETLGEPKQEDLNSIIETLKVAFDLGALEFSNADHPSREQRRVAARLGMAAGMVVTLSRLPPTPALGAMIASLTQKVDLLRDESVMDWSYRLSKKITQYSRTPGQKIVLKNSTVDWDERASNPFVTFELTYENQDKQLIHVDMEVQCASVPRDNPDDTLEWLRWSVKTFRFNLQPGERYVASGKLQWYATKELMPRLIFPPKATALISTEYVK